MSNEEFIESVRIDGESWKDISGYEGLYMVSSYGRVVTLSKNGKGARLLRQSTFSSRKCTYKSVLLYKDGAETRKLVHRLVAESFLDNPKSYPEVDHINRDGTDNNMSNLRWCTRRMNMANPSTKSVLERCHDGHDGSYRWRPVVQIKDGIVVATYKRISDAEANGFSACHISDVCRGGRKTHFGFQWMYLSEYENIHASAQPTL